MKIYVAHSKDIDYMNDLYIPLRSYENLKNYEIILPHEHSASSSNTREFYKTIDLFIAEVSKKGTGLGIELGWVYDDNIPIYCIYKSGQKIAGSLKSVTNKFYEYATPEELLKIFDLILEDYNNLK